MTTLAFIDTETTGLHRKTRRAWDVAVVLRAPDQPDREYQFFLPVNLSTADPYALKVGGFWGRHPRALGGTASGGSSLYEGPGCLLSTRAASALLTDLLRDATWVGAVPSFDEDIIVRMLLREGMLPTWDYHLVDIESWAAGALRMQPPWRLDRVTAALGVTVPEADRHTALGDARGVRDAYDAVLALESAER